MEHTNTLSFKKALIKKLESFWLILAILALISSVMCLAVAFLALVLPGVKLAMLAFLIASLFLGLLGRWSIYKLRKRGKKHIQLFI